MLLNLTTFSEEPIHSQIVSQVIDRIIDHEMSPGDELLPIGKLSRQQHIGKSTIAKAYSELERMGIIQSIQPEKFIINNLSEDEINKLIEQKRVKSITPEEQEITKQYYELSPVKIKIIEKVELFE